MAPAQRENSADAPREVKREMRWGRLDRSLIHPVYLLALLALVVAIALIVRDGAVSSFTITQRSMEPTLQPGEEVLAYSASYWGASPAPGDLVTFFPPVPFQSPIPVVKRVAAIEGDTVQVWGGHLIVNGRRRNHQAAFDYPAMYRLDLLVVPQGSVFVLGDNRAVSEDSTSYGPIPEAQISDIILLRISPWRKRCSFAPSLPGFPHCPGSRAS